MVRPGEEERKFQVGGRACAKAWRQEENCMFKKLTRLWPGKKEEEERRGEQRSDRRKPGRKGPGLPSSGQD